MEMKTRREIIESEGGNIEIVDIIPKKEKTATPVLLAPGWGTTPKTLEDVQLALAGNERRVISLSHPRLGGEARKKENYPPEELRKATSILNVIKEKGDNRFDIIGYSEGGINSILAAKMAPDKIRNIILLNPGGIVDKDNFLKLSARFLGGVLNLIKEEMREGQKIKNTLFTESLKYITKNPARALKEVGEIAGTDIKDILRDLRKEGIGISIIHGVDDSVFSMDDFQRDLKKESVDGFYSVKGDHWESLKEPDKYMSLVDQALSDLETKKQKEKEERENGVRY